MKILILLHALEVIYTTLYNKRTMVLPTSITFSVCRPHHIERPRASFIQKTSTRNRVRHWECLKSLLYVKYLLAKNHYFVVCLAIFAISCVFFFVSILTNGTKNFNEILIPIFNFFLETIYRY